jgi:hypothetical protein
MPATCGTVSSTAIATLSPGTVAAASGGKSNGSLSAFRAAVRGSTVAEPFSDRPALAVFLAARSSSSTTCSKRTSRSAACSMRDAKSSVDIGDLTTATRGTKICFAEGVNEWASKSRNGTHSQLLTNHYTRTSRGGQSDARHGT